MSSRIKHLAVLTALGLALAWLPAPAVLNSFAAGYTISPTSGPPGTVISFTGTGCLPRSGPDGIFVIARNPTGAFADQPQVIFESEPDGSFSGTIAVPADLAPGTYSTGLGCYLEELGWMSDPNYQRFTVTTPTSTPTTTSSQPAGCPANPSPTNAADPSMVVNQPATGARVSSPVTISGRARVFEATVSIKIYDAAGNVITDAFTTAAEAGPVLAPFSTSVAFSVSREQAGCIRVFEASARDGSPVNVVQVPVTLLPSSPIVPPSTGDGGLLSR